MTFIVKDRVKDATTTTGTGTVTLSGTAPIGFQAFSVIGNGNTCAYTIALGSEWEVGIGTYSTTGPTLARTTVLRSSNADAAVNFSAGTKDVFITVPGDLVGYQQIGTTQTPSGVASSSITSIPDRYSDLLIEFLGLSHNSGSGQVLQIELSPDGVTWTTPAAVSGSLAAADAAYGSVIIPGYRKGAGAILTMLSSLGTADNTVVAWANANKVWRISAGISAVRLSPAAGNFDAGSWKLWGRL